MFEAYVGDSFLDCGDDLDALIAELTKDWQLEADESVAIWLNERRLVAAIQGREGKPPAVLRFDREPAKAAPAAA